MNVVEDEIDWRSAAVRRAIASLEPLRRRVIELRYFRRLRFGQIAATLKQETGRRFRRASTIEKIHDQALRHLRTKLRAVCP